MDSYISSLTDPNVFTIVEIPVIQIQDELGLLGNESNVPICYVPVEETSGEQEPDPSSKCRICAVASHDLVSIFGEEGAQEHLESKIHRHLPIKVMREDTLPTGLCRECIEKLNVCHNLVNCSIETEKKLRALFEKSVNEESEGEDYIEESVPMHDGEPASIVGLPVAVVSGPESEATHCTDNKFSFVKCEEPDVTSESITGDIESRTDSLETKQEIHFEDETFGPSCGKYENVNVCSDVENVSKSQADTAKGGPGDETDDVESDHFEDGDRKNGDDSFSEPMETQDTEVSRCKTSGDNVVGHDSSIEQKQDGDDDEEPYTIIEGDFSYTFILLDNFKKGEEPKLELVMVRLPLSKEKKPISINPVKVAKCLKNFSASQTDGSIQLSYDEFSLVFQSISQPTVSEKPVARSQEEANSTNIKCAKKCTNVLNTTTDFQRSSFCKIAVLGDVFPNPSWKSAESTYKTPLLFKTTTGFKLFQMYLNSKVKDVFNKLAMSCQRIMKVLETKQGVASTSVNKSSYERESGVSRRFERDLQSKEDRKSLYISKKESPIMQEEPSLPTYRCRFCKANFGSTCSCNIHLTSHVDEKPSCNDILSETATRESEFNKCEKEHSKEEAFSCDICHKSFECKKFLKNHSSQHQQRKKCYSCEICGKCFNTSYYRDYHLSIHLGKKPHRCAVCNKSFRSKSYLNEHVDRHFQRNRVLCEICGKSFPKKDSLRHHVKSMHFKEFKFTCRMCKAGFHTQLELRQHTMSHSEEEKANVSKQECEICGNFFSSTWSLSRHKQIHTDEKPYGCNYCNKKFRQDAQRKVHEQCHTGVKPFQCQFCYQRFPNKAEVNDHESSKHTGKAHRRCKFCDSFFQTRNELRLHQKRNHSTVKIEIKCNYCDETFESHKERIFHENTHSDKLPFGCDVCHKRFRLRPYLVLHSMIHVNTRSFTCSFCPKKFKSRRDVKLHSHAHIKEKPYACNKCGKTFLRENLLKAHQARHDKCSE